MKVTQSYDSTATLLQRIKQGARPDVLIGTSDSIDDLGLTSIIDRSSRTFIARVGMGVAVLREEPKPDISTVAAFVETLRSASSVAYSKTGASGLHFAQLIQVLGIADELNSSATLVDSGFVGDAVVAGRADLAIQSLSELQAVPGIEIVGPLPAVLQVYTCLVAALGTHAKEKPEAIRLIHSLVGTTAKSAYTRAGLETSRSLSEVD